VKEHSLLRGDAEILDLLVKNGECKPKPIQPWIGGYAAWRDWIGFFRGRQVRTDLSTLPRRHEKSDSAWTRLEKPWAAGIAVRPWTIARGHHEARIALCRIPSSHLRTGVCIQHKAAGRFRVPDVGEDAALPNAR
jgi:hypothetical protein